MAAIDVTFSRKIDGLFDMASIRALTRDEMHELELSLLVSDETIGRFVNRCQLECDLRCLLAGHAPANTRQPRD